MSALSWAETVRRVRQRADNRCEYCQTAQRVIGQAMHAEHLTPDGRDELANLCLSCPNCGLIVERVTDERYLDFMRRQIMQPLGLSRPHLAQSALTAQAPGSARQHANDTHLPDLGAMSASAWPGHGLSPQVGIPSF